MILAGEFQPRAVYRLLFICNVLRVRTMQYDAAMLEIQRRITYYHYEARTNRLVIGGSPGRLYIAIYIYVCVKDRTRRYRQSPVTHATIKRRQPMSSLRGLSS